MTQLQNIAPQQPQPLLPQSLQAQPQSLLTTASIPLKDWNKYGFTIPASTIRSWIAKARINGIMREGAVKRFGQRYYVTPYRLDAWMDNHGERTPLTRSTQRRRTPTSKAGEARAPTDGKEQQAVTPPLQAQEQPTQARGQRHQMTDAQVRQIRRQFTSASSEETRAAVVTRLAKRYGFTEKAVRDVATGRTYRHLPMPQAQTQAVETAAPA
jgi:hypothetical protein